MGQNIDNSPYFKGYQNHYSIFHWTTSNGLPQSHISGIAQTRNNLLWISTYNGVVSFDGKRFNSCNDLLKERDLSTFITTIHAIGDSVIWTSTKEAVIYYNKRIIRVFPFTDNNVFIPSIKTLNNKIYLFSHHSSYVINGNKLQKVLDCSKHKQLNGHTLLTCVSYNGKLVYLTSNNKKTILATLQPETGKIIFKTTKKQLKNISTYHNKLLFQIENQWFLATNKYEPGKIYRTYTSVNGNNQQSSIFPSLDFYYSGKTLQINSASDTQILNVEKLLQGNELFASFVDHTGNLWLGTNSTGIFMFRRYPFYYPTLFNGLNINNSSHSFVDKNNVVWFDNECRETYGIDLKTSKIIHRIPGVCNWANADWSEDSLAFFSFGTGHTWYNRKTRKSTPILNVNFPVNYCFEVKNRDFILGAEGALYRWDGTKTRIWKRFKNQKTTCNQIVRVNKDLYFATSEGVYRFSNGIWKLIVDSKKHNRADFRSLLVTPKKNHLLIGSAGSGIFQYHLKTGRLRTLAHVPISLRDCWAMIPDQFGQLWISSNNGIVEVDLSDLERSFEIQKNRFLINHYRFETGIENVEFNSRTPNKAYLLPNGHIVFSSLIGPTFIKPQNNAFFNNVLSNIIIERVDINGKQADALSKKLSLKEGDFVQIQFTLSTFSPERALQFEYRIKGYRDEWTALTSRQITLDNLPSGKYALEIRLTSNKRRYSIHLDVNDQYPNLWILYFIGTLLGTLIIVFITVKTMSYLQKRKNQANSLKQQLKMMEIDALRAQMNPHFIFNCLNTIQFLFMSGNNQRANKYLSDFSALMRLTLDLMRESLTTLHIELKATQLYINLEQLQFDEGFEFKLIDELKTPHKEIITPTMFLQLFVENAIIHGLKNTESKRPILTITMSETEAEYVFTVSDNGPGYNKLKTIGNHKSVGLEMLRERLNLKSELYQWNIDFKINQTDAVVNDIRTTVTITFGKTLNTHLFKLDQ